MFIRQFFFTLLSFKNHISLYLFIIGPCVLPDYRQRMKRTILVFSCFLFGLAFGGEIDTHTRRRYTLSCSSGGTLRFRSVIHRFCLIQGSCV